ncbi:hypothetical protein ACLB1Q_34375 [Escherichia coli]
MHSTRNVLFIKSQLKKVTFSWRLTDAWKLQQSNL